MRLTTFTLGSLLPFVLSTPTLADDPPEIGSACGAELGDCPSLTCIPLTKHCTDFSTCRGTCQEIDPSTQRVYNLCGGWGLYDDCDERVEFCTSDPRNSGCGPSCDGPGICAVTKDYCGGEERRECDEGMACFGPGVMAMLADPMCGEEGEDGLPLCTGNCFPLRFGSDSYEKTGLEEVWRDDLNGDQADPEWEDGEGDDGVDLEDGQE